MKYILILISFLFVLTCTAQTKRLIYEDGSTAGIVEEKDLILKHVDTVVVVIDGQSNSIGQQSQSAKTYSQKNVQVWTGSAWTNTLQTGSNPFNANGANNIGLQFALKLAKMRPTSLVRLIASGNSGQPISYWLSSPYTGFINTDNLVLNAIGNAKVDVFIWVQGESDYNRSRTQYISDYYTLRSQGWLLTSWYTQNTRHINVGLYDGSSNVYGFHNETLKQIGSDSIVQTSYAPVFGLGVYDNIHWNNTAIDTIGQERVYNAYLSTPYAFQQKMTRISQVESELSVSESLKENLLILRSDADSTGQNQNQNTIFFDGKYWSGASSASADNYSDAAITSYKDNVNGAGGAGLLFRTSSSGAGGLQIKARINKEGVFDALGGFRINGQAQNNLFMVGNGSIFSGRSLASSDVTTALSPTNRFVFANANLATMTINGGDGTSGTNGAYVLFKKDNVSNFFFGNESAAFGGTTNNAVAFVYGSNAFRIATNSTRQFSVEGNGNVLIGSMLDNGNKFQVSGNIAGSNIIQGLSLYSTATTGTAPLNVLSTTLVNNLNVALLNGQNAAYYQNATNINAGTLADARLSSNVALKNADNSFSVAQTVAAATTANHALQLGQFNTAVSGSSGTYAKFAGTNSIGNAFLKDDVNGTYFESSAIERFRMHTDGRVNVGGITNRYSKFNVLGGINADSIIATIGTFSGIVNVGSLVVGTTNKFITVNTGGLDIPRFTTSSVGSKVIYRPTITASAADYAVGVETGFLWNTVPTTSEGFKWYGGTTLAATLTGTGNLTTVGNITATTLTVPSTAVSTTNTQIISYGSGGLLNKQDVKTLPIAPQLGIYTAANNAASTINIDFENQVMAVKPIDITFGNGSINASTITAINMKNGAEYKVYWNSAVFHDVTYSSTYFKKIDGTALNTCSTCVNHILTFTVISGIAYLTGAMGATSW